MYTRDDGCCGDHRYRAGRTQNAVDQLQPLVETSARRLVIAQQIALAKWDDGAAVEDAPRIAKSFSILC